ncbi:MAG TPA: hypothetical protein VFJ13_11570, partial [Paracoccaceae bacterium]|nr:hypothetical protein [Paracoccaceae bacterium]
FVGAILTYLALLWALRGEPQPPRRAALPDGISRADHDAAIEALAAAGRELRTLAVEAPAEDMALIRRMADLVEAIRGHHEANPAHVPRTRIFVRHTLGRMVAAVAGYVDLARRAGPDGDDRLAEILRRLEGFVPVLERIDRACIENDLMALEISVEVLDEQLGRDRDI